MQNQYCFPSDSPDLVYNKRQCSYRDKKHLHFEGNAMEEIELQDDDLEFVKQFDIIYAERWAKVGRYIKEIRHLPSHFLQNADAFYPRQQDPFLRRL